MFLSLTNANPVHYGCPIAIDSSLVVTVHHSTVTREDGSRDDVTFIFCPPHGTWEVQESFEAVLAQLNMYRSQIIIK
jgi:hypothetical protein